MFPNMTPLIKQMNCVEEELKLNREEMRKLRKSIRELTTAMKKKK